MPQMFKYCGQRFQVYKRAHKTCDPINGPASRRLPGGIHLNLRCDGQAYGGCQAGCMIFWKGAWLRLVDSQAPVQKPTTSTDKPSGKAVAKLGCTEDDVWRATKRDLPGEQTRYICQATQLANFTTPLKWWDPKQYVEDYRSGNASLGRILRGFLYLAYYCGLANRRGVGSPARWLYDRVQSLWGGILYPRRRGLIPSGAPTPRCDLNLQPGELVRVKPYQEILATLDGVYNRGLTFDAEQVPYCEKVYRVKTRVENFIDEKTGRMRHLRTPAIILEGVYCGARYSGQRMFCPRSIYSWWREIWLERVSESQIGKSDCSNEPRDLSLSASTNLSNCHSQVQ